MQETINPLNIWHKTILDNDPAGLYDILDDSFEFYSPAVFKSKEKYMGYIYLLAASQSFLTGDFKYTRELIDDKQAVLEFECTTECTLFCHHVQELHPSYRLRNRGASSRVPWFSRVLGTQDPRTLGL